MVYLSASWDVAPNRGTVEAAEAATHAPASTKSFLQIFNLAIRLHAFCGPQGAFNVNPPFVTPLKGVFEETTGFGIVVAVVTQAAKGLPC